MKKTFVTLYLACGIFASNLLAGEVKIGVVLPASGAVGGFGELGKRGIDLAYKAQSKTKNVKRLKLFLLTIRAIK